MNNTYVYNEEYKTETKNIKDSIIKTFDSIKTINFNNTKSSKLCFNFIKGNRCKWHEQRRCRFAHSIDELKVTSTFKVLELGMQAFYYIYGEKQEKNKHFTIFDLVNIYKKSEHLFKQEHYNLYKSRVQYNELHKYIFKLKKELEVQNEIGSLHLRDNFDDLINSDCLDISIKTEFNELQSLINSTIGCKICYKNIIELGTESETSEQKNDRLLNNYNIITLSCGHSICEHCHIELINKKSNIYVECPLCRNINNISNTKPNYELNEQIFKIKLIFSKLKNIHKDIKSNYKQLNTNNFFIKNKKNGHVTYNKNNNMTVVKSFESPW
jgi:hypothetical protein